MLNLLNQILYKNKKLYKPIFIIGCGRSGSTILFDIFSQHPNIKKSTGYPDGEDHEGWIKYGDCKLSGLGNNSHQNYNDGLSGHNFCKYMDEKDVNQEIIYNMHFYFQRSALRFEKSKRLLNKMPHLSNKIKYLLSIFKDAKIIHLIRDCEPVVLSWINLMKEHPSAVIMWPKNEQFPCFSVFKKNDKDFNQNEKLIYPSNVIVWIKYWCEINKNIIKQIDPSHQNYSLVKYEDFVKKPEYTLNKLTSFCELKKFNYNTASIQKNSNRKHLNILNDDLYKKIEYHSRKVRKLFNYK